MKKKYKIKTIIFSLMVAAAMFYIGIKPKGQTNPQESYSVYLDGKKIGMIESKDELLEKINNEQESIKKKYGVDQVFPPVGLEIVKHITYENNFMKTEEIYNKINGFSIKGFTISIVSPDKDTETKYLYVLNKEDFDASMQKLITVFIPEESYNDFINDQQKEIADTGEYIKNIYLNEKIYIKEGYISTEKEILTNDQDISRYLLYGSSAETKKYTVKSGDTLDSIAEDNDLNVTELLIANPDLKETGVLLSGKGDQTINVSLINPAVNIISETDLVEKQVAAYETIVKYDNKLNVGYSYVEQQGENGVAKVKYSVKYNNGDIAEVQKISANELTPSVNKIIIKGGYRPPVNVGGGEPGEWGRPTVNYCKVSSPFGYRKGEYHDAIDITGCGGLGSPIFAAADGIVITSGRASGNPGIHIRIDHQNGYYTSYLHLSETYVKVGQTVNKGDRIGAMGATGRAFGVHLHFSVYYIPGGTGFVYNDSYALNPYNVSPVFKY